MIFFSFQSISLIQRAHACFMGVKLSSLVVTVCALDPIHYYYYLSLILFFHLSSRSLFSPFTFTFTSILLYDTLPLLYLYLHQPNAACI